MKQSLRALLLGSVMSLSLTSQAFCVGEEDENKGSASTTIAVRAPSLDDDPSTPLGRFEVLPNEILEGLFGFMENRDLGSLSGTSQVWNAFIKDHLLGKIKHLKCDDNVLHELHVPYLMRIYKLLDTDSPGFAEKIRFWLTSCPLERLEILIPTFEVMIAGNVFERSKNFIHEEIINELILEDAHSRQGWWLKGQGYKNWKPYHLRLTHTCPEILNSPTYFKRVIVEGMVNILDDPQLYSLVHLAEESSLWLLDVIQKNEFPNGRFSNSKKRDYFGDISTFLSKAADQKADLNLLKDYYEKLPASLENDINQDYNRYIITSFIASNFDTLTTRPKTTKAYKKVLDLFIDQTFLSKSFPSELISSAMDVLGKLVVANTNEALAKLDWSFSTIENILNSTDKIHTKIDAISKHLRCRNHVSEQQSRSVMCASASNLATQNADNFFEFLDQSTELVGMNSSPNILTPKIIDSRKGMIEEISDQDNETGEKDEREKDL